ncbi:MAG: response regulator [bacterium]|nr:response regulator [bacterium]
MSQHRILLIEDDEDLATLYRIGLEKEGFIVYTSKNGLQGITKAIEKEVDLVLLDLMMPLADGRDVLAMLRLNAKSQNIPVIIISNLNPGTLDLSQYDDQVIDYWVKSEITPKMLASRLQSYFS